MATSSLLSLPATPTLCSIPPAPLHYPDRISTNGRVVVALGAEVLASLPFNSTDLPLSPTDLNPDQPPPSVLDPNTDPGNVNADGVNSANQGLIDIDGSGPLSCSVGTTQ